LAAQNTQAGQLAGQQMTTNYQGLLTALQGAGRLAGAEGLSTVQADRSKALLPLTTALANTGEKKALATGTDYASLAKQNSTNYENNVKNYLAQEKANQNQQVINITKGYKQSTANTAQTRANAALTDAQTRQIVAQTGQFNAQTKRQQVTGTLAANLQKLGIQQQTANTAANRVSEEWFNAQTTRQKVQQVAKVAFIQAGIKQQSANTAANRVAEEWAALHEKKTNDAATQAYRSGYLKMRNRELGNGGTKPLSTLENNAMNTLFGQAVEYIQSPNQKNLPWATLNSNMVQGHYAKQTGATNLDRPVPDVLAEAAHEVAIKGTLKPSTARMLQSMGVRGLTLHGQPVRVRKSG
jgi:hypothetical protein